MARRQTRRLATRPYEIVYIFDTALEDGAIAERLEQHHALLELEEPAEIEHWGRRQLAYQIGRHENGYYAIANVTVKPAVLPEFERALKLDESVVRYLITLHEREYGAPPSEDEEGAEGESADATSGDAAAAEAPAAETPAAETPAAETPAAETPAAETPAAEASAAEAAPEKTDAPAGDAPAATPTATEA